MTTLIIVLALALPLLQILPGLWMWLKPPKNINAFMGYRTARSSASQEAWDFAQRHIGRLWLWVGGVLFAAGAVFAVVLLAGRIEISEQSVTTITYLLVGLFLAALIVPIFFTEAALKKNFDEWGRPVKR